ncbi:DHH family phosphoesterase [Paenibacillus thermotolerans]|uniref:DHH family phosphoesterase n=1 Tax=Paenibacillus thermotolerans TaxID=3027807 RepID=UPI0023686487|nr:MULTISPECIES: bifunctional oligoribonuclease/PAP phosphatase NrnA [unclassified Paenibacillus]
MNRYKDQLEAAAAFIMENDDFLVVSHLSPDGDAIGSTSAVGFLLKQLGKSCTLINEGRTPDKYMMLLGDQTIINYSLEAPSRRFGRVIAVDCADFARIGGVHNLFEADVRLLNIDHHPTNDLYGSANLVRPDAAATVEIIYELGEVLGVSWTKPLASSIYGGLLTDTGGFRYSNTTPNVLRIAERMLQAGAEGAVLAERLLETMTYPQMLLLRDALSTLEFSKDRQIAWLTVSLDTLRKVGAADEDSEGLVNIPRNVEGVQVGMLFKEKGDNVFKVSLRSAGKVDVAQIAKQLGGGGHVRAAGCTVEGRLNEVVDRLVEAVNAKL